MPPDDFKVVTCNVHELENELNGLQKTGYLPKQIFPHQGLAAAGRDGAQLITVIAMPLPSQPTPEQLEEMKRRANAAPAPPSGQVAVPSPQIVVPQ